MAYRRRQGLGRSATFKEEIYHPPTQDSDTYSSSPSPSPSLAAQAIRASAAHRDSSLSSAYANPTFRQNEPKGGAAYDYTLMDGATDEGSFWGVLARKAKAILEEDIGPYQAEYISKTRPELFNPARIDQVKCTMNRIGDTIGNAFEEGRTMVENKTADFIQETRRLQMIRKADEQKLGGPWQQSSSQEDQLKASRDVAMATAAKAKLLLRELKTVKADLAFAKQRCSQLEEENRILREAREKGVNPEEDDMIRLQLETLLEEKARLANENAIYARENRFLREIVEYHQLTMQDVVYLDEGIEEVTEVYPVPAVSGRLSISPGGGSPPSPASHIYSSRSSSAAKELLQGLDIPKPVPKDLSRSSSSASREMLQALDFSKPLPNDLSRSSFASREMLQGLDIPKPAPRDLSRSSSAAKEILQAQDSHNDGSARR